MLENVSLIYHVVNRLVTCEIIIFMQIHIYY